MLTIVPASVTSVAPGTLAGGTATVGATTTTTAAATASDATGGTAPYTYQWYRSTVSGQLGTAVSGQATRTLADTGLSASTAYFYTLRYTDAAAAHADSNQIAETTSAVVTTVNYLSVVSGFATGLTGVIGYQLFANGSAVGSRTTAGIAERPAGSGTYRVIAACPAGSLIEFDWDDGSGVPLVDGTPQAVPGSGGGGGGGGSASFDSGAVSGTPLAPTVQGFYATGAGLLGASGDYIGMSVLFQATGRSARSRKVSAHSVIAGVHFFAITWSGYPLLPSPPAVGESFEVVP